MQKLKTTILASLIIAASLHGFAQPKEIRAASAKPAIVKDPAFEKVTDDP